MLHLCRRGRENLRDLKKNSFSIKIGADGNEVNEKTMDELTNSLRTACEEQSNGVTTFIEVILNQELGEPFRRDAMKKPVKVAGIKKEDMKPQKSLAN